MVECCELNKFEEECKYYLDCKHCPKKNNCKIETDNGED